MKCEFETHLDLRMCYRMSQTLSIFNLFKKNSSRALIFQKLLLNEFSRISLSQGRLNYFENANLHLNLMVSFCLLHYDNCNNKFNVITVEPSPIRWRKLRNILIIQNYNEIIEIRDSTTVGPSIVYQDRT